MARHSQYPQHKVDEALLAYYTLGTYEKAGEHTGVPWRTIGDWVTKHHKDRYDELVEKHGPTLERQVVGKLARTADKAADRVDAALDATGQALAQGNAPQPKRENYQNPDDFEADFKAWAYLKANSAKDANALSSAAKNAALVLGIVTDKKLTLEGRPTHITEHRDLDDILKSLNTLVPGLVIEGTADEIPTPQHSLSEAKPDPLKRALRSQPQANARDPQPV